MRAKSVDRWEEVEEGAVPCVGAKALGRESRRSETGHNVPYELPGALRYSFPDDLSRKVYWRESASYEMRTKSSGNLHWS
jgi:hypothetical protein